MLKLNSSDRPVYFGFSDEVKPAAAGLPDGAMFVYQDKPEVWIVRKNAAANVGEWSLQESVSFVVDIPLGGLPDAVSVPNSGGAVRREVVALGGSIPGQPLAGVEILLGQLLETNAAILAELRIANLLLQGIGTVPVKDDLDDLRAYVDR